MVGENWLSHEFMMDQEGAEMQSKEMQALADKDRRKRQMTH